MAQTLAIRVRFITLCSCFYSISDHDINADMLREKKPFQEIFPKFLQWIRQIKEEVSKHTGVQHYPGCTAYYNIMQFIISFSTDLATHKGFSHGICFLLAEIESI